MCKSFKWLLTCSAVLFIFSNSIAQSQPEVVAAINKQLIPLKTLDPDADFSDLERLREILKDKPVVGIGEATHGTHEFFVFKHRMLEFLVKQMGFKTFVLEDNFGGIQTINDYVVNGKGDIINCMQNLGFNVWRTNEFKDMITWIKNYNDTQSPENKVKFFGCDMQWGTSSMQLLKRYLSKTNQYTPQMEEGFTAMKKGFMSNSKDKKAIRNTVESLNNIHFENIDTTQIAMYKQDLRILQQYVEFMDAQSKLFPAKALDVRDKYMAENCEWIYNFTGQKKMMIWAHNAHINKSAGNYNLQPMGMVLAKSLKDKYYAMGFDFTTGKLRGFDTKAAISVPMVAPLSIPGSSGSVFAQCSMPNFILDFKSASTDPILKRFLTTNIASFLIGGNYTETTTNNYVTHKLADTYDAIIFIKDSNAATSYKSEDRKE